MVATMSRAADPAVCLADARKHAAEAIPRGTSRDEARRQLEIESASCLDPGLSPSAAYATGAVNADRARLASDFFSGKLTLAAYRAALSDRRDKLAKLLASASLQRDL